MKILKACLIIIAIAVIINGAPLIVIALAIAIFAMKGSPKENATHILEKTKKILND